MSSLGCVCRLGAFVLLVAAFCHASQVTICVEDALGERVDGVNITAKPINQGGTGGRALRNCVEEDLVEGIYDLYMRAPGFESLSRKIAVTDSTRTWIIILNVGVSGRHRVEVKVSPMLTRRGWLHAIDLSGRTENRVVRIGSGGRVVEQLKSGAYLFLITDGERLLAFKEVLVGIMDQSIVFEGTK